MRQYVLRCINCCIDFSALCTKFTKSQRVGCVLFIEKWGNVFDFLLLFLIHLLSPFSIKFLEFELDF